MSEQILVKKKKRLVTDFNSLTPEELIKSGKELRDKLKKVMSKHIGEENYIGTIDLFREVFEIEPETLDVFQRAYWWSIIKSILKQMRHSEELFTVIKAPRLFVLKTQKEADYYKSRLSQHITALENLQIKSDRWMRKELWRNL